MFSALRLTTSGQLLVGVRKSSIISQKKTGVNSSRRKNSPWACDAWGGGLCAVEAPQVWAQLQARGWRRGVRALRWVLDVARGMAYLHQARAGIRIAHRDLKCVARPGRTSNWLDLAGLKLAWLGGFSWLGLA